MHMEHHSGRMGVVRRVLGHPLAVTTAYFGAFFSVGLALASIGPTMIMLAELSNSDEKDIGFLFPVRSGGYILGSLFGGPLSDRYPVNRVLAGAMFGSSLATLLLPMMRNLVVMALVISVHGITMGLLDTGGNVALMWLHGSKVGPYMQALHFTFTLGAFFSPVIIEAFTGGTDTARMPYAFWTIALMFFPIGVWLMFSPSPQQRLTVDDTDDTAGSSIGNTATAGTNAVAPRKWARYTVVGLTAAFLGAYVGCEVVYGGFLYTYAVRRYGMAEDTADFLTALYWGTMSFGRALGIPLAICMTPVKQMVANLTGSLVALTMLRWNSTDTGVFWAATGILGLFMASVFPTALNVIEAHIKVSGKMASVFMVGASIGEMLLPLIVTVIYKAADEDMDSGNTDAYVWLIVVTLVGMLLCVVLFVWLVVVINKFLGTYNRVSTGGMYDDDGLELREGVGGGMGMSRATVLGASTQDDIDLEVLQPDELEGISSDEDDHSELFGRSHRIQTIGGT